MTISSLPQSAPQFAPVHANYDTNRSLTKFVLLGIITFGIYMIWSTARAGDDLNAIASRWDNRRSMNFWLLALVVGPLTLGIAPLVWWHVTSERIGNEQQRRGLPVTVTAADFWLWSILGAVIFVGPFIFMHKWLTGMNQLCADFNARG
ncbi:DUF4234 domain-containing protein [Pseudoclavibacter chungangensis]|uniref:DUF4234 domain-containing protein n=1 Tax=Pseudoclavibacter chungangensis TaxID=587635 RepID=A0A7J5BP51_9MICO|nr:DUF4234 domain-containing protein [Pseudoclavibacter chungangensis]KAB1654544.1 DUF4234 domain-containing protein [Pseudoclavibacter chungangensis]NYJ68223.1 multisubunit Na+/H+ antiporter MnhB subunit [Pseudoclavibacter chungangensis]